MKFSRYCEHCGAYIPEGQKRCLACGMDLEVKDSDEKEVTIKNQDGLPIINLTPLFYQERDVLIGNRLIRDAHMMIEKEGYSILEGDMQKAPFAVVSFEIRGKSIETDVIEIL